MPQTFYAIVGEKGDDDLFTVELLDAKAIDEYENFYKRAETFYEKSERINTNNYEKQKKIITNYYLDVTTICLDSLHFVGLGLEEGRIYYLEGYHRRRKFGQNERITEDSLHNFKMDRCIDVNIVERQQSDRETDRYDYYDDFLEIMTDWKDCRAEEGVFFEKIDLTLSEIRENEIELLTTRDDECIFTVYNTGQALATSLSRDGDAPFLYFDYGLPYGRNAFTPPVSVTLPTNADTTIILSHIHQDHWYGLSKFADAYKCRWFIPNQKKGILFNKKIAEIFSLGGTAYAMAHNLTERGIEISCRYSGIVGRPTVHKHETGFVMRLEGKDVSGQDFNILVSGDQCYDYTDPNQLLSLDVLVASHHGGEFSQASGCTVPNPRNANSSLIYSCGKTNTYNHPSKNRDYQNAGWQCSVCTFNSGDIRFKIKI